MEYFETNFINYHNEKLYCESISVEELAEKFSTPLFIYSANEIKKRYKEFFDAFDYANRKIFFACKSNNNLSIIKLFLNLGAGIDVNSAGEILKALKAGASPEDLIMSGVGKTDEEIELAIKTGIKLLKVESFEEAIVINEIAKKLNKKAEIAYRINPNVDPKTHPYITTGLSENKFGFSIDEAFDVCKETLKFENVSLVGVDMHIGSQITKVDPFVEATEKLAEFYIEAKRAGAPLKHFDIGGGMGVRYFNEKPFNIKELADMLKPIIAKIDAHIFFEPGRYFMANAGILVSRVLYTKKNKSKNFIIVDAAMTELMRPTLYGSYHHIQPVVIDKTREDIVADIVGPVCESGDFLAKNRTISKSLRGDLLAIMSSGAYGMAMSSNYNMRKRAAEILVDGDKYYEIRKRENYDYIFANEPDIVI